MAERTDNCEHCLKPTSWEHKTKDQPHEGEVCYICDDWVCDDCVDWKYMDKLETETIICKRCSAKNLVPNG